MIKIGTQIYLKQDVPQSLVLEAQQYALLSVSARTTSGSGTFVGTSNTINYTNGTQELYDDLDAIMFDYRISSIEFDNVRSWINGQGMPVESGYRQTVTRDSSGKVATAELYTSSAMTTLVSKQTITRDSSGKVASVLYDILDTDGITSICQFTDVITRDSSGKFLYQDRTVAIA